ncbi:unnamed protein product [Paramecium primaurelia]|uniref:Uncharacterized protein n=1 Tax=Paramecium primaurelia TaxID=5886 RepID=A0A8S1QNV3_PARPR|nr:unnamed protein product [Paramecium primaurelia]
MMSFHIQIILLRAKNIKFKVLLKYEYEMKFVKPKQNEYFGSDCLMCQEQPIYYCKLCPLNESEKCFDCPQLIQVCLSRSKIKITAYKQQNIVTNQNAICNEKCIKPYAYPATYFDPYNQFSGYCFDKECNDSLLVQILILIM